MVAITANVAALDTTAPPTRMEPPAVEYVRAGLALVRIPFGQKGDEGMELAWNTEPKAIRTDAEAARLNGSNVGLAHRWSDTCAVDVDDYATADAWLKARGIDLDALLAAEDAVQISSGRENRAKLLYDLPESVDWLPTLKPPGSGIELRCANRDGTKTLQDVLPPSIHPDTGKPYQWRGRGHWSARPILPDALLKLWLELAHPSTHESPPPRDGECVFIAEQQIRELRQALCAIPADDYDLWVRMGLALKTIGNHGQWLWLEWSQTSDKFDPQVAARAWANFNPTQTGYAAVFAEAQRRGWVNPASKPREPVDPPRGGIDWPEPKPLPTELLPVPTLPDDLLPERLRPWVSDIAERVQCAPEFVAVPAMAALGSLIGRRVGIRPQERTDWTELPNLWGCIVGRPGVLKSPAMTAALTPLSRLAARARAEYTERAAQYEAESRMRELRAEVAKAAAKKRIRDNLHADVSDLLKQDDADDTPPARRYSTNDSSYQALAELLIQNPNGLLVVRDELVSLLSALDAEENAEARGFYLTGWNGDSGYTVDRIGRGLGMHVEAVCLSMIGGTQPGRLASYINAANRGGAGDDGLIQRFGLLVWPDQGNDFRNVDRWPDDQAKRDAFQAFEYLDGLTPEAIGAERERDFNGEPAGIPFLRFGPQALEAFTEWRIGLERTIRAGDLSPALESHFAKYRKLVPALALTSHLADGYVGSVTLEATLRAIAWADFLAPHARRAYGSGPARASQAARAILSRIRKRDIPDGFVARDVYRPQWSGLTDRDTVREALALLEDHGYLASRKQQTGGAPQTVYTVNPRVYQ